MDTPKWPDTPEERIIREMFRSNKGGMQPGTKSPEFGRLIENLLIRELTKLANERTDQDIRFSRGWIVEDYGTSKYPGASASGARASLETGAPRLDIICYHGDIAWNHHQGIPHAMVPQSYAYGFIEVKRTLNPKRLHEGSSAADEPVNDQLARQRRYIESLGISIPQILIGAHYWDGSEMQVRQEATADHVGLIGSLTRKGSAAGMANEGELESVLNELVPISG